MSLKLKKWVAIINPNAGKVAVQSEWIHIQQAFAKYGVVAVFVFTEEAGQAIPMTKELIREGYRNIAVIGGDGTLNEVVNGVMLSNVDPKEITLAVIPNGTGNDWARHWGIDIENYENAVALLVNGDVCAVDIGKCTYMIEGRPGERYFLNTAGMGFEVKVLQKTDNVKRMLKGHSRIYGLSVLYNAMFTRSHNMTLAYNGNTVTKKIFSFNVGNGRYSGGGFAQNPTASATDGRLDVMIMSELSLKKVFLGIKYLFTSRLLKHPSVKSIRTEKLVVSAAEKPYVEVDGVVIPSSCPVTFSVASQVINFVVPRNSSKK